MLIRLRRFRDGPALLLLICKKIRIFCDEVDEGHFESSDHCHVAYSRDTFDSHTEYHLKVLCFTFDMMLMLFSLESFMQ